MSKNELVDSAQRFKSLKHLSAKDGDITLIEFIEENPIIIQNPGMSSKIQRYIQSSLILNEPKCKDVDTMVQQIEAKLGNKGGIIIDKKLPLLGQLAKDKLGCVIMENNLYKVPLWKQKMKSQDFLLVKTWDEDKECFRYYVRRVNGLYIAGQIEPSLEVYSPNSRFLTNFIKKCLNFQIKQKFKENGQVNLSYLKNLFPSINDHGLRKAIKDLGGEQDLNDSKIFKYNKDLIDSENESENQLDEVEMSPEEVCLYEKKCVTQAKLKKFGLKYLKLADKINLAKGNPQNLIGKVISQLIAEELQLTSWNLTQSYINAKKSQGRLCLTGIGDPTNGHGGISFIKQPLKISRHEKENNKTNQNDSSNNAQPLKTTVTKTDADLRTLKMADVKKILIKYGYNGDHIEKLQRWEKIELLRELSNKLGKDIKNEEDKEILKYARSFRETTKMQREKYQKEINRLFAIQFHNLSLTNLSEIQDPNPEQIVQESIILGDKQPQLSLFYQLLAQEQEKINKELLKNNKEQ